MNHLEWVKHMKGQFSKYYSFNHIAYVWGSKSFARKIQDILSKPDQEVTKKDLEVLMHVELSLCNS